MTSAMGEFYKEKFEECKKRLDEALALNIEVTGNANALKAENKALKAENEKLTLALQMKSKPDNEQREQRRFEAAKVAMQGMKANPMYYQTATEKIAEYAVEAADFLLEAIEDNQ